MVESTSQPVMPEQLERTSQGFDRGVHHPVDGAALTVRPSVFAELFAVYEIVPPQASMAAQYGASSEAVESTEMNTVK
jgi:hypothetical protein